ncbi:hypothetical protein MKW94_006759, partial [Papaver nudicaule]|nr:hypothetical protein [Papaver nudicaule]
MQSSTFSFGPCLLNKPYIESSFLTNKNRFGPPKKLVFPVSNKKLKSLIVKSSIKGSVKSTSAVFTNHIIPLVFHSVAWVVRTLSFKPKANWLSRGFFEEGDLIQLNHDGNYIVGVVQHVGFSETTLIGPVGLIILQNLKIDRYSIENCTQTVGNEKSFGFYTLFHRKTDVPYEFIEEIKSVLEKNEIIKGNHYNGAFISCLNLAPFW